MKNLIFLSLMLPIFLTCTTKKDLPGVIKVYPTSDSLPENLLRMYVLFSQPMKTDGNLEKIKLIDADGNVIQGAIFNNVYELWDKNQQQLTLLFDPSRVKKGLKANEIMGRALRPGIKYRLIIDGLEDINHRQMKNRFVKEFHVGMADTIPPAIDSWKIITPISNSLTPLEVYVPEMLDWLSAQQRLIIASERNEIVSGSVSLENMERCWKFFPEKPWSTGMYILHINTRLEDPSGNNLNGLFDHAPGTLKFETEGQARELHFEVPEG